MKTKSNIDLFSYVNYRKYLEDYYNEQKKSKPSFSYRYFAKKAGYNSSGLYKDIVDGRTNITSHIIVKISRAIGHNKKEAEYFENMVYFLQAKDHEEKNHFIRRMIELRKTFKVQKIEDWQYECLSKWYNPVIRELVIINKFNGDYAKLGMHVNPSISGAQVKKSIELLLKIGLIKKQGHRYVQSNKVIATDKEVSSLAVRNYHKKMAILASEAYDRSLQDEREISSCTISISGKSIKAIKAAIHRCKMEITNIAISDKEENRVYQANFQIFPLSKMVEKQK